jgi:hypothetical protein
MVYFISPPSGSLSNECLEFAAVGNPPPSDHTCLPPGSFSTNPFPQDTNNGNVVLVYGPIPDGGGVVSHLYVQTTAAAPAGGATVQVLDNGNTLPGVSCTIAAGTTSCAQAGGSTVNVSAGHYLAVRVTFAGGGTRFFRGSIRF